MASDADPNAAILEFTRLGARIRVSAIDPESLVEVVIMGPASAGEAALSRVALQKLAYALRRQGGRRAPR